MWECKLEAVRVISFDIVVTGGKQFLCWDDPDQHISVRCCCSCRQRTPTDLYPPHMFRVTSTLTPHMDNECVPTNLLLLFQIFQITLKMMKLPVSAGVRPVSLTETEHPPLRTWSVYRSGDSHQAEVTIPYLKCSRKLHLNFDILGDFWGIWGSSHSKGMLK